MHTILEFVTAILAGIAIGYLIFAIQEAQASNDRVWQALAQTPPAPALELTDAFIRDFTAGKIEDSMREKYGVGFEK